MLLFCLLIFISCKLSILDQTMYHSTLISTEKCWITVPKSFLVISSPLIKSNNSYFGDRFILIKPLRKMYEYEDDIERGIDIIINDDITIKDISNYPDFSAQLIGIALTGFLYSIMFKLF